MLLLKGDRSDEDAEADPEKAQEQVALLRPEITKGMFTSSDEDLFIDTIGGNNYQQNRALAVAYENEFSVSLGKVQTLSMDPQ